MNFPNLEKNKKIVFALLAISFAALMALHLTADANPNISFSSGIFADEFLRATPSKETILRGEPLPYTEYCDECTSQDYSEPHNTLLNAIYFVPQYLLGIKISSLHIAAILISVLTFMIFVYLLDRAFGFRAGLAFGFLFVFNFLNLEFGKLALVETFAIIFLSLSFLLLVLFLQKQKAGFLYAAAVFFFLALLVKTTALFFVLVFIAAIVLQRKKFSKKNIAILLAIFIIGLVYSFFFYSGFVQTNSTQVGERLPKNLGDFFRSVWLILRNRFFVFNAFAGLLVLATVIGFFRKTRLKLREITLQNSIIALLLVWILAFIAEMAFSTYQPTRYFMLISMPTIALAGIAFHNRKSKVLDVLLFLAIAFSLFSFFSFAPTYYIANANAELKNFSGNVLCGGFGYTIFFEAEHMQCYAGGSGPAKPEIIQELGIEYIVTIEGNTAPYDNFFELEKIKEFRIGKNIVGLQNIIQCLYGNECGYNTIGLYRIKGAKG